MSLKTGSKELQVNRFYSLQEARQAYSYEFRGVTVGYRGTYGFSAVDGADKQTQENMCCISFVGFGESEEGSVSSLLHISPIILGKVKFSFLADFERTLKELRSKSTEDSRRAIVVGGYDGPSGYNEKEFRPYRAEYLGMLKLVDETAKKHFGVGVEVHAGPKTLKQKTDVYVFTQERNVIVVEPEQSNATFPVPSKAEELRKLVPYSFRDQVSDTLKRLKLVASN